MSDAAEWLAPQLADAPAQLRARMLAALPATDAVPDALVEAAMTCLRAVVADCDGPEAALELLSADALLTHACAAAAEHGEEALLQFTAQLDATRFQRILDQGA
jgi:hypothetical protein